MVRPYMNNSKYWFGAPDDFMDLETEVKPRFLNYEEPRVWFLADLNNGMVIQLPQTAKPKDYIYSVACVV